MTPKAPGSAVTNAAQRSEASASTNWLEADSHASLVTRAHKWLDSIGCGIALTEFSTSNGTGEIPDAIGWRSGVSILVEAKTSRGDFLADKMKPFRIAPELGVGDWRFILCPPNVVRVDDLPTGWGLLYAHGTKIQRVHGIPRGNCSWGKPPFIANKTAETRMLYSALRRLKLRGVFDLIYEPLSAASNAE